MGQRGEGEIWRGQNEIRLCRVSLLDNHFAILILIVLDTALVPLTFVMN
jgi:hypothetical protein